jgi:hypothetical protein
LRGLVVLALEQRGYAPAAVVDVALPLLMIPLGIALDRW